MIFLPLLLILGRISNFYYFAWHCMMLPAVLIHRKNVFLVVSVGMHNLVHRIGGIRWSHHACTGKDYLMLKRKNQLVWVLCCLTTFASIFALCFDFSDFCVLSVLFVTEVCLCYIWIEIVILRWLFSLYVYEFNFII